MPVQLIITLLWDWPRQWEVMDENLCTFGIMDRADLNHFFSQSSLRGKKEKVDFGWVLCLLSRSQGFAGVE